MMYDVQHVMRVTYDVLYIMRYARITRALLSDKHAHDARRLYETLTHTHTAAYENVLASYKT